MRAEGTAVREVDRSVDRVQDPQRPRIERGTPFFLAEIGNLRHVGREHSLDGLLDLDVDRGRVVPVALGDQRADVRAALAQ